MIKKIYEFIYSALFLSGYLSIALIDSLVLKITKYKNILLAPFILIIALLLLPIVFLFMVIAPKLRGFL